jgi:transcription elongation factor Elf1
MEHNFESNIKCPYCDWEDRDSWEFGEDSGIYTCGNCGEEFNVERNVEVTYSTTRISCKEKGNKHDYQFESVFVKNRKFEKGIWADLPETEWTYHRVMVCSICGDKEHIKITKDEYERSV